MSNERGFFSNDKIAKFEYHCRICSETNQTNPVWVEFDGNTISVKCILHQQSRTEITLPKRNRK